MNLSRARWLLPAVAYFIIITLIFRHFLFGNFQNTHTQISQPLPSFAIERLDASGSLSDSDLHGQVALVHFFASWCGVCRFEQPELMTLARDEHIPLYGIAWRDSRQNLKAWLGDDRRFYRAVGMDKDGKAAIAFGIWGVPETYLVDRDGTIRYRYRGNLSRDEIQQHLLPLYRKLYAP